MFRAFPSVLTAGLGNGPESEAEISRATRRSMLLYVGPELWMPLTSVLGTVVGIGLMFWRHLVRAFRRAADFVRARALVFTRRDV